MKNKVITIWSFIEIVAGFIMYLYSKMIIDTNDRYTWTQPFTYYEERIMMIKYVGIVLIVFGIIMIGYVFMNNMQNLKKNEKDDEIEEKEE